MLEQRDVLSKRFAHYFGDWQGHNSLWLSPQDPVRESAATARIGTVAGGRFLQVNYIWTEQGKPQDGLLMVGVGVGDNAVKAVWVDSWHMGNVMMDCPGTVSQEGRLDVLGAYAAPPGPDWGWRIVLELTEKDQPVDSFKMLMYNIPPEGKEELAVETIFTRLPASESGAAR
jgi:hypothetical protein